METPVGTIETLFHEKILLYQDLLDIVKQEHRSILETDVDALWKISDKKQLIVSKIEAVRCRILAALTEASIPHDMDESSFRASTVLSLLPEESGRRLKTVQVSLISLKDEIHSLVQGNKRYVEEYLNILDELFGLITNVSQDKPVYDQGRYLKKSQANLLLHREV